MLMSSGREPGEAKLQYGPNGFRVLRAGQHVFCAVSGEAVPLDELRYWSTSQGKWVQDASTFDVWIGSDSTAPLHADFTVVP